MGHPASLTCEPHTAISTHLAATETQPLPPQSRCCEGTSSASQQELMADPTCVLWHWEPRPGCILHSPSGYDIHPSQQVLGLERSSQQPIKPILKQNFKILHWLHTTCYNDHRPPALPNMHQGSMCPPVLPTSWPDSQKNRLQVPDKHLERAPCPGSRSTQNVSNMDTHKVFALYALSKGGKRPLTKQEAAGFCITTN